jgi:hypothetical protein
MTTKRSTLIVALLCGVTPALFGQTGRQRLDLSEQRASFQQALVHNGKWLTAAGVAAFSIVAATEHRVSRRDWNSLLTICRSSLDACTVGADGRYVRADAEALYQRSRAYDRRANRWLVGGQVSLIATTALFIIDLHPGQGPENIPFPARLRVSAGGAGAVVGLAVSF